jgi:hypothetical protein
MECVVFLMLYFVIMSRILLYTLCLTAVNGKEGKVITKESETNKTIHLLNSANDSMCADKYKWNEMCRSEH